MKNILILLLFVYSQSAFSQKLAYSIKSNVQLRSNNSSSFFAEEDLVVTPGNTLSSIGFGILGKKLLKHKGKVSIESGVLIQRNKVNFTTFDVIVNVDPVQVLDYGKTRSYSTSSVSLPMRIFYNGNHLKRVLPLGGIYIGPVITFETFNEGASLSIYPSNRLFIDAQLGARTGLKRFYLDVSVFTRFYNSSESLLLGNSGISISLGYRLNM